MIIPQKGTTDLTTLHNSFPSPFLSFLQKDENNKWDQKYFNQGASPHHKKQQTSETTQP